MKLCLTVLGDSGNLVNYLAKISLSFSLNPSAIPHTHTKWRKNNKEAKPTGN